MSRVVTALPLLLLLLYHLPASWADSDSGWGEDADPAQVAIGERLFLETLFSQYFFAHAGGNPNAPLTAGDPVTTSLVPLAGPIPGPFAGQGINCRS